MTNVERIQKGLDKKGLIKVWDDLSSHTDYVRGLILTEAKHDCDNNSSMSWEKYIGEFILNGKPITSDYARKIVKATTEKIELKENLSIMADNLPKSLRETEAELKLPESASTQMELRGENAVQKARNYSDVIEATGKEQPSAGDIRSFNSAKKDAEESMNAFKEKATIKPKIRDIDPFTSEEEIDFETWCEEKHDFDLWKEKPKHTRAIYALKDDKISALFKRLDEWKGVYKTMAKLCHPDAGGDATSMSFLTNLKELMDSLEQIQKIINYENKVKELRVEYSTPSK